jgi:hypothetical protein
MKIDVIGDIVDNPDGSGQVELDVDAEGAQYLMQLGFEVLLLRGIKAIKHDKEMYERNR